MPTDRASSHLLALFQSAAAQAAASPGASQTVRALPQAAGLVAAMRLGGTAATTPAGLAEIAWDCARAGLGWLEARLAGNATAATRLEDELAGADCDPHWLGTLGDYLGYFGPGGTRRAIPYRSPSSIAAPVLPMKPGARIALLSDWGLGTAAADAVLAQAAALRPDILVHLGDIYYSGTARECEANFRAPLARRLGPDGSRVPVYTLSGNHDMYSGGHGYYDLIDGLNPPMTRQPASWFCLRATDDSWQLLAMDTGLHDHDPFSWLGAPVQTCLDPQEVAWIGDRLREFPGRTILLSHHPLFSAFRQIRPRAADGSLSPLNDSLAEAFASWSQPGRIAAWFWGHEHNLCVYRPFAGLERGRCVGNGAIPVFLSEDAYRPLASLDRTPQVVAGTQLGADGDTYAHGSTLLVLGDAPRAEYYQTIQAGPLFVESLADPPPSA